MARKRKIPARKHHGVRDPLKQIEEREKRLQNVVNNPPEKGEEEKISFKFAQFKKLVDASTAGRKIKRIRRGVEDLPRDTTNKAKDADTNKFKSIKQFANETDGAYLKRVNRLTRESLREAEYEIKYGVKVVRNPKTGEILIKKKPKNEIDELLKQKRKKKKGNEKEDKLSRQRIDPKTAKELIKQAIKENEEERERETLDQEEYKRDHFKFGEVVHGPPTLTALPRKATKSETVSRPGKKNLLLKELLSVETALEAKQLPNPKQTSFQLTKSTMKGKRKDLPKATRKMLEDERTKMVELYRSLKKSKDKKADVIEQS